LLCLQHLPAGGHQHLAERPAGHRRQCRLPAHRSRPGARPGGHQPDHHPDHERRPIRRRMLKPPPPTPPPRPRITSTIWPSARSS
jgi:hypothetical protein